jgi:hypothetical protein
MSVDSRPGVNFSVALVSFGFVNSEMLIENEMVLSEGNKLLPVWHFLPFFELLTTFRLSRDSQVRWTQPEYSWYVLLADWFTNSCGIGSHGGSSSPRSQITCNNQHVPKTSSSKAFATSFYKANRLAALCCSLTQGFLQTIGGSAPYFKQVLGVRMTLVLI